MPAYEIPNLRFSGDAGAVIARRRFVKLDASGAVVQASASTDSIVGVSSQPAGVGEVAEIYDGIVMVEAGAAIPLLAGGTPVMADADGKAIPYVAGAGVLVAGIAMTAAGAAGELLSVKI